MTYETLYAEAKAYLKALDAASDRLGGTREERNELRARLRPDPPALRYSPLTDDGLIELVIHEAWSIGYDNGRGKPTTSTEPYARVCLRERLALQPA